ncbi:DUF4259 domain-containing protein [Undibacterium sp. Di27W]|uniref:DUF4259 domain-containing protein n=1 Tax=Undibacterium sp. Di27W TaxID=3413036 RepID=UPI003BF25AB3
MKKWLLTFSIALFCTMAHAGAWGPGSFENDTALDWVASCIRKPGIAALEAALTLPAQSQTIEDDDGIPAIAAAEVVAAAMGKPARQLPAELRDWLVRQTRTDILKLLPKAKAALIRIKNPRE